MHGGFKASYSQSELGQSELGQSDTAMR